MMSDDELAVLNGRADAQRALADIAARPAVRAEPVHDGNYWRGALAVIAERQRRIRDELALAQLRVVELGRADIAASKARAEAVLASRNDLPRTEVARILGVKPATVTAQLRDELRRRGMGVQR